MQTGATHSASATQRRVLGGRDAAAARHAEGGDLRLREALAASSSNSSRSFGFDSGKPASISVDPELVEAVRDAQLLLGRERHALALHAVAQGGVV